MIAMSGAFIDVYSPVFDLTPRGLIRVPNFSTLWAAGQYYKKPISVKP